MSAAEIASVVLRTLGYAGAIGVAGGALFRLGFPAAANGVAPVVRRQILGGFLLLLAVEPLRYAAFQLAIADGDWALAFGPDLRWMGLETPIGQAALVRLAAAAVVVIAGLRVRLLALAGALTVIGSFLIEGHTAASATRPIAAPLLFVHLAAVSWWIGALPPLLALTRTTQPGIVGATMRVFGRRAAWIVGALLIAGAGLAVLLTGGVLQPDGAYQQRLLIKLALVAALLSFAAWNKLRLTPLLATDYAAAVSRLRVSIRWEIAIALVILTVSAWLVTTAPAPEAF